MPKVISKKPGAGSRGKQKGARAPGNLLFGRKDEAVLDFLQQESFNTAEFISSHYRTLTEKEIDQARSELTQLNEYCKHEVQKVVHDHHKDFLEASRGIHELDSLVDELRNYVSATATVVANLKDMQPLSQQVPSSTSPAPLLPADPPGGAKPAGAWAAITQLQSELLQDLQVAVAEHDFATARALLAAGRDMLAVMDRDAAQLAKEAPDLSTWRYRLEVALQQHKAALVAELQRHLSPACSSSSPAELRQATQLLSLVKGPCQAARALLQCHSLRVRATQQQVLKTHSAAGGDPDGVEYAGGLAQRTFLALGAAIDDVRAVFSTTSATTPSAQGAGEAAPPAGAAAAAMQPAVAALVAQWAADEARQCGLLLRRHALGPLGATGSAVGSLLCVSLALVFCAALEHSHGLALGLAFLDELWPQAEDIVRRHLRRMLDEAVASAGQEIAAAASHALLAAPLPSSGVGAAAIAALPPAAAALLSGGGALPLLQGLPVQPPAGLGLGPQAPLPLPAPVALGVLVTELRSLADVLAPLALVQCVALLRKGAVDAFAAVCETAHAALQAAVGSSSKLGAQQADAGRRQLAGFAVQLLQHLEQCAEADMQAALAPLSAAVGGPVAAPQLLTPSLRPLRVLLSSLPSPEEPEPQAPTPAPPAKRSAAGIPAAVHEGAPAGALAAPPDRHEGNNGGGPKEAPQPHQPQPVADSGSDAGQRRREQRQSRQQEQAQAPDRALATALGDDDEEGDVALARKAAELAAARERRRQQRAAEAAAAAAAAAVPVPEDAEPWRAQEPLPPEVGQAKRQGRAAGDWGQEESAAAGRVRRPPEVEPDSAAVGRAAAAAGTSRQTVSWGEQDAWQDQQQQQPGARRQDPTQAARSRSSRAPQPEAAPAEAPDWEQEEQQQQRDKTRLRRPPKPSAEPLEPVAAEEGWPSAPHQQQQGPPASSNAGTRRRPAPEWEEEVAPTELQGKQRQREPEAPAPPSGRHHRRAVLQPEPEAGQLDEEEAARADEWWVGSDAQPSARRQRRAQAGEGAGLQAQPLWQAQEARPEPVPAAPTRRQKAAEGASEQDDAGWAGGRRQPSATTDLDTTAAAAGAGAGVRLARTRSKSVEPARAAALHRPLSRLPSDEEEPGGGGRRQRAARSTARHRPGAGDLSDDAASVGAVAARRARAQPTSDLTAVEAPAAAAAAAPAAPTGTGRASAPRRNRFGVVLSDDDDNAGAAVRPTRSRQPHAAPTPDLAAASRANTAAAAAQAPAEAPVAASWRPQAAAAAPGQAGEHGAALAGPAGARPAARTRRLPSLSDDDDQPQPARPARRPGRSAAPAASDDGEQRQQEEQQEERSAKQARRPAAPASAAPSHVAATRPPSELPAERPSTAVAAPGARPRRRPSPPSSGDDAVPAPTRARQAGVREGPGPAAATHASIATGHGTAARNGDEGGAGASGRPLTAKERLAARMAAKGMALQEDAT